jgi:alpha-L-rhamnosidase
MKWTTLLVSGFQFGKPVGLATRWSLCALSITLLAAAHAVAEDTEVAAMFHDSVWISAQPSVTEDSAPAPFLRREFEVKEGIKKATLAATARGVYQVAINGRRVCDAELLPGWSDYSKRLYVHKFDVTGHLIDGTNAIGAMLGDGWYAGYLGWENQRQVYGKVPELLLSLSIEYQDGSVQQVSSDTSWKAREGPIRYSDIYHGESYDARLEMPGWNLAGYDDSAWSSVETTALGDSVAVLEWAHHAPIRRMELMQTVDMWEVEPGRWIFDMGQNMVGWVQIQVPSIRGMTITIRFAEMLQQDRTLYTENYRSARSTNHYVCRGGQGFENWEPTFTFHGFRYAELSGLPPGIHPDKEWVKGVVLHSDFAQIGTFACSNPDINQLQQNIIWGQKGNFIDVPTDCPQRDERLGWTGDAQVFCPTACFNYDVHRFFRKWMVDLCDAQREDGAFPHVAPNVLGMDAYDSPAWADAGVIVPWEVYQAYGDVAILRDNYDAMRRWIAYQEQNSPELIREERGFGDWLQPFADPKNGLPGDTDKRLIGTAHFAYTSSLVAKVATLLGDEENANRLNQLNKEIRIAFQKHFWIEGRRLSSETQTAYLLALAFDLLPEADRPAAVEQLIHLIEAADGHLRTGFVGTPLLNRVLTRFGHTDLAYSILLKETYPGWFFSIRQGATTMWERWNSYSHADGFGDAGMNSFNHYAYGAIGQWLYETVAGLAPLEPGYKAFSVAPEPRWWPHLGQGDSGDSAWPCWFGVAA